MADARNWIIGAISHNYGDLTFSSSTARGGVPETPRMTINKDGNVGIGTTSPSYPLEIDGDVSGISLYTSANISATGYNTRTSVFDTSKNVWDYIKDASDYLTLGKIDHSKFYGYVGEYSITDYSKQVNESYEEEVCEEIIIKNETTQQCYNETKYRIIYPYTKQEAQISINKEIDLLRQAVYELKTGNDAQELEIIQLKAENQLIKLAFCKEFPLNELCNGK